MCFTAGNSSRRHYERAVQPPRPVDPVFRADRYEKPRRAPLVPPHPQARKRTEAQVKKTLRDAEKIESNRHDRRFATSDRNADKIRERALARAKENKARAPPPPPPVPRRNTDDSDSHSSHESAYPAPLNIRKKSPQPPQKQQHAANPRELGNTTSAIRSSARPVDESHIHPALRSSAKPIDQSHIHPALRTTGGPALRSSIHPALRNLPATPARPRRASDMSQSSLEREGFSCLGNPENYADSLRGFEVSPLNVKQEPPKAASRRRR